MNPITSEFVIGLLAIGLNYAATFKIPSTSLLKDPVQTLSTTVPVLAVGHVVLIILSHLLKGTTNKAIVRTIIFYTSVLTSL
jgi:phosphatidylinositol glycan class F